MNPKLSEKTVADLPSPKTGNRVTYFAGDTVQGQIAPRGFGVRVTAAGAKSFVLNYRVGPRERRFTIGEWKGGGGAWAVVAAIKHARELRKQIDLGTDPLLAREAAKAPPVTGKTVSAVLDEFVERYLKKENLRSADYVEKAFTRLVKPRIGSVGILDLRRSAIVEMLDKIEDENGQVMADRTLAYLRKALNWYASRDDEFNSPIVRGMARTKPRERARDRALSDEEIRDLWTALDKLDAPFPSYIRTLLLTGQRRTEVSAMQWDEIEVDNGAWTWTIPAERYKSKRPHAVPLTDAVRKLIDKHPTNRKDAHFVFSTTGGTTSFSAFSKFKAKLDVLIADARKKEKRKPIPPWTLHDLRRTARSLLSRAGVGSDIAEQVLGHVLPGVRGTYDRHTYLKEKRDALERLAVLVDRIVNPPADNVVRIRKAVRR